MKPSIPKHWPKRRPFPWPFWSRTCPGCGRYHRHWHLRSDFHQCAYCFWQGDLAKVHRFEEPPGGDRG